HGGGRNPFYKWACDRHYDLGPISIDTATSPVLRASSASFVEFFFPAMRPDSQAPVIWLGLFFRSCTNASPANTRLPITSGLRRLTPGSMPVRNRENSGRFRNVGHATQHQVPAGEKVPACSKAGIPLAKSAPGSGLRLRR